MDLIIELRNTHSLRLKLKSLFINEVLIGNVRKDTNTDNDENDREYCDTVKNDSFNFTPIHICMDQ